MFLQQYSHFRTHEQQPGGIIHLQLELCLPAVQLLSNTSYCLVRSLQTDDDYNKIVGINFRVGL